MKLVAAKVTYLNENHDVVSEIRFGYESIAQISEDGKEMSLVFVVPTEKSKLIEDRSTSTPAMKFLGQEVNAEKLLKEVEFVLTHSTTTAGKTSNDKCISTDFGYVQEFFNELLSKEDFE